ncbi:hypothetical protein, variant [Aphanomyces invadans]|uniref:RING-type E3 ubiquitin transferase n=1 Tax=Aphanomyces invadans TaxID=157072 RepID=A0A024UQZ0_9STRA|nr:hypothetical protein, variant [Aphanomyces invadans]ETW08590.1 hypothetical protein, variant [Aphanomyces invadans]|eukprot:XP_008862395.1 hypothetical protein, variant [Aphanomyces invadans]
MASWISAWVSGNGAPNDDEGKDDSAPVNQPSAEEVRQKRLERLAALEAAAATAAAATSATIPAPIQPPATASSIQSTPNEGIKRSVVPLQSLPVEPLSSTPLSKRKSATRRDPLHNALQQILGVTLTESHASPHLVYVAIDNDTINADNLSEVLYSRLLVEDPAYSSTLEYLFAVYQRVRKETSGLNDADLVVVLSVQEQCVNYSVTCLLEPEMFPSRLTPLEAFDALVRNPNASTPSFLDALALGIEAQGGVAALGRVGGPILQKLVSEVFLGSQSILAVETWAPGIQTIGSLVRIKGFATVFTNMPGFLLTPPLNGRRLQDATALGILLRFSSDAPDPAIKDMFANITKRSRVDVNESVDRLRSNISLVQNLVTDIFRSLLRGGATSKDRTLQWLEQALVVNVEAAKENPNLALVSTAGMLINLNVVLLRLCGPFFPPSTKHSLIDATFWNIWPNPLFPEDATKLVALAAQSSQTTSATFPSFNFITQCFFLTARAVHLGTVSTIGKYMRLMRQLSYMQNHMNDQSDPRMRAQFEMLAASKMIIDAKLLHPELLHELIRFALLSANVTCRMCLASDGKPLATTGFDLPLPTAPDALLLPFVPEHIVEDIIGIVLFVARFAPDELKSFAFDDFLTMTLIFLSSPQMIRSPHLRAKMSECLYELCLPSHESEDRPTASIPSAVASLVKSKLAQQHLAPCLLALYGDVEQTGFYEKLEHRYNIACLLKYLWKLPDHKAAFVMISQNQTAFVKFAHGLMNHINSLLTDALTNLPEIKSLQEEAQSPQWLSLDEALREQKQSLLAEKERTVTSSLQLANETIHMMSYLTSEIRAPFLTPELEDRLVGMLNSVLVKLAGPRGLDLKVTNPEMYKFRPKVMLREIVGTILHFSQYDSFQHAVASNGLYDPTVYRKCTGILQRTQLVDAASVATFDAFAQKVEALYSSTTQDEALLGDIPEEFMDPLLWQVMKDPVTLPSGYIVDKSTITQHLMNDPSDPFTRAPLSIDQLVPNSALKAKIEAWVAAQTK